MQLLGRLFGVVVMVVAVVGFLLCIAVPIGIWRFRQNATEKVETVSTRLEAILQRVSGVTATVQKALEQARTEVDDFNKESANLGSDTKKNNLTTKALRKFIDQKLGPKFDDLGDRLATFSDAAVAASSLLESLEDLPAAKTGAIIQPEKLKQLANLASRLPQPLKKLSALVGSDGSSKEDVVSAANEADQVLQQSLTAVNEWKSELDAAGPKLQQLKTDVPIWLTRLAIAVTVFCVWMAIGQISLLAHGWKWFRGG